MARASWRVKGTSHGQDGRATVQNAGCHCLPVNQCFRNVTKNAPHSIRKPPKNSPQVAICDKNTTFLQRIFSETTLGNP